MRYIILLAAILMQMCLGATYSWSVYVTPLKFLTGLQQGAVQAPFTVFYLVFPLTVMFAGKILRAFGPSKTAMLGGIFFGSGWIVASLGQHSFLYTSLGIGLLAGIGAGIAYIIPITVCIRWFPNNKGLVTGVAVAGFGGGAALVSKTAGWLIETLDKGPFETFYIFGLIFMCVTLLAGSCMRFPKENSVSTPIPSQITLASLLHDRTFLLLYIAMFLGLAAGFAVNANLKELYSGPGDILKIGITGVALFALANATGRILWGAIFDKLNSTLTLKLNLFCQGLTLVCAPSLLSSDIGFWCISVAVGFNYGGILVLYVSSAARKWGAKDVAQVYSFLFSANIPASFAPIIAGIIYDRTMSFSPFLYALGGILFCCVLLVEKDILSNS